MTNDNEWRINGIWNDRDLVGFEFFFFFFCYGSRAPLVKGFIIIRGFTIPLRHTTLGSTPLKEWSARRRDVYLTTHNIHNRQTPVSPVGFEATTPPSEGPQTHILDSAVTGNGPFWITSAELVRKDSEEQENPSPVTTFPHPSFEPNPTSQHMWEVLPPWVDLREVTLYRSLSDRSGAFRRLHVCM